MTELIVVYAPDEPPRSWDAAIFLAGPTTGGSRPADATPDRDPPDAGREWHAAIRPCVDQMTDRLYGDLPAADLATAARVPGVVRARASAELES